MSVVSTAPEQPSARIFTPSDEFHKNSLLQNVFLVQKPESLGQYCWLRPTAWKLTFEIRSDICAQNVESWKVPETDFLCCAGIK